jgi:hypothetical protein
MISNNALIWCAGFGSREEKHTCSPAISVSHQLTKILHPEITQCERKVKRLKSKEDEKQQNSF